MSAPTLKDLKQLLETEGFDPGAEQAWTAVVRNQPPAPWFIRGLTGFGAWVAGLLIACGLIVILEQETHRVLLAGLLVCAVAWAQGRKLRGDFGSQLALALSVAGQVMTALSLETMTRHLQGLAWLAMLALEGLLLVLGPDPRHRFLATAAGAGFCCLLLDTWGLGWLGAPLLGTALLAWWAMPPRAWTPRTAPMQRPVLIGLAVAFCIELSWLASPHPLRSIQPWQPEWLALALSQGGLLGAASWRIQRRLGMPLRAAAVLVWAGFTLLGLQAPGVSGMLFLLVLATAAREPALAILAALAGAFFLSRFYYDLHTTLLVKAGILLASGILLLGLRLWMDRKEARCSAG